MEATVCKKKRPKDHTFNLARRQTGVAYRRIMKTLFAIFTLLVSGFSAKADGLDANLKVLQVTEQGFLANGYIESSDGSLQKIQDVVFVFCKPENIADGDSVSQKVFPAGTMKYKSVIGTEKTVRAFSLSHE